MGPDPAKWFIPVLNSPGTGLSFPVSEDVKRALRGLSEDEDEVFRRNDEGRWMVHD